MVDIPGSVRPYLNDSLESKLETQAPETLNVLIEVERGKAEQVESQLPRIPGLSLRDGSAVGGLFIPATLDVSSLGTVSQLDGVKLIHADTTASILQEGGDGGGGFPFPSPIDGNLQTVLSDKVFDAFTMADDWGDATSFNDVVVPHFNFKPLGDPVQAVSQAAAQYGVADTSNRKFIPTSQSVDWLLDGSVTDGANGSQSKVAVIDTGHTPMPDVTGARLPFLASFVPGEAPLDTHGHGSWCTNTVVGKGAPSTWGQVKGVAPGAKHAHMKALNTIPGTGMSSWILKSMEAALDWGADVISMSLGGRQQGPLDQDPYATFIREWSKENAGDEEGAIFVVAASNSGPGKYEVGSPGVAEKAITVASWSLTDEAPAVWSSRGPQGAWYKDNPDRYSEDRSKYGADEFVKPDVAAPGGGRATQELAGQQDEYLHQAEVGWMEGMFDGIKDGRGGMHGTSCRADTLVPTPNGPTEIIELSEGDEVFSLGDGEIEVDEVVSFLDHGAQPVYEMETATRRVTITEDHPVLVVDRDEVTYYDAPGLKKTRKSVGLTQQALADATDVPVPSIKSYENQGDAIPEGRAEIIEDAISAASDIRDFDSVTRYECKECGHSWTGSASGELSTVPRCSECRTTNVVEGAVSESSLELVEKRTEIQRNGFEWKMVGQIDEGDPIAIVDELPCEEMEPRSPYDEDVVSERGMWLLGAYAGDGWTEDTIAAFAFPEGEKPRGELVEKAESELSPTSITEEEWGVRVYGNHVEEWFERSGVGHGAKEKEVPQWIHTQPREQKVAFVAGYAEADGHLNTRGSLVFECANEDLMRGMKHLLDAMGFRTGNIRYRKRTNPWKEARGNQPGHQDEAESWTLRVIGADSVEEIVGDVPVDPAYQTEGIKRETRNLDVPDGIRVGRVKSIEYAGEEPVYDIETAENHNFLAENTVTHNSQATPHVAGLVLRLYEAGIIETAAEFKQVVKERGTVPQFADAGPNANASDGGKNVSVGFGVARESLFEP